MQPWHSTGGLRCVRLLGWRAKARTLAVAALVLAAGSISACSSTNTPQQSSGGSVATTSASGSTSAGTSATASTAGAMSFGGALTSHMGGASAVGGSVTAHSGNGGSAGSVATNSAGTTVVTGGTSSTGGAGTTSIGTSTATLGGNGGTSGATTLGLSGNTGELAGSSAAAGGMIASQGGSSNALGGSSAVGGSSVGPVGGASVIVTGGTSASNTSTAANTGGGSSCPWVARTDLDNAASAWAIYTEGSPTSVVENVSAPSTGGGVALRCGLTGGAPYSNSHCYRNLPLTGDPQSLVLRLSFWYSPPSTYNNAAAPSVVQGIEFTTSKWQSQQRYELALQWQNVGAGAPQWRYWDANQTGDQRWLPLAITQTLTGEQWHTLELRGEGANGTVHYCSFEIDGVEHPLDITVAAASTPGEDDRLAVAVQLDGNSTQTPWDLVIDNVQLVTCDGASCPAPTTYYEDADSDGFGVTTRAVLACQQPSGYAAVGDDCNDDDPLLHPATTTPTFNVNRCGQGNLLDGMDWSTESSDWQLVTDGQGSMAAVTAAVGCHDGGTRVAYSLVASTEPNWVVLRKVLPAAVDMSHADFLLTPFKGSASEIARTLEFKLEDAKGCRSAVPFTAVTTLPVFRTAVTSLQQFTRVTESSCAGTPVDLGQIKAIEIGISEIGDDVPSRDSAATGQVTFDDITFVSRDAVVQPQSFFECVPSRGEVLGRIARSFVRRQQSHGFIATWYPETTPSYNVYGEAVSLIVLSKEFARTGRTEYATAAKAMADRFVALQSGGKWFDTYADDGAGGLTASASTSWVGNVSWVAIALHDFIQNTAPADTSPYTTAIDQARAWLEAQIVAYQTSGGATGGITSGTEGNVSTYFALKAAGATTSRDALAQFISTQLWDTREQRLRMGVGYWGLAIDIMGNWGADFLRSIGNDARALSGLSLAAGIFPVPSFSGSIVGMGDIAGPWEPTVEFTGQYAAAGGQGAAWLMEQMLLLEDPNEPGAFPGAPDDFGGGDGWNTKMTGVPPGGWVYLGMGEGSREPSIP